MLHPCQSKASKSKVRTRWSPHILSVCEWKIVDAKKKGELPLGMGLSWRSIIEKEGLTYLHSGFELDAFWKSLINCLAIIQSFTENSSSFQNQQILIFCFPLFVKISCCENIDELKALLCKIYDSSTSISPTRKVGAHICAYIQKPPSFLEKLWNHHHFSLILSIMISHSILHKRGHSHPWQFLKNWLLITQCNM